MHTDPELELIRGAVSCSLLLERHGYKLDVRESTRNNPKYRRAAGEIIIINHHGQGWWDPGSTAKGDVFALAQHLEPSLTFGQARRALQQLVGLMPSYPPAEARPDRPDKAQVPPNLRWAARPRMGQGSPGWHYLVEQRGLTPEIIAAAVRADNLRDGPHGSAWFAHRDGAGTLTGIEMRGPDYRGFSAGGDKSLFRLQLGREPPRRLAVLEAPIKAMALAALEGGRNDTLYVATAGGMGPLTLTCLKQELAALAVRSDGVVVAASDADAAGEKYAVQIGELARAAGLPSERAAPTGYKDWDDVLKASREAESATPRRVPVQPALARVPAVTKRPRTEAPASGPSRLRAMVERMRVLEQRTAGWASDGRSARTVRAPGRNKQSS